MIYKNDDGANVIQFGTGDIEVGNGRTLTDNAKFTYPTLFLTETAPGDIGRLITEFASEGDAVQRIDAHTLLVFTKVESVDVVIHHLEKIKERLNKNGLDVLSIDEIGTEVE